MLQASPLPALKLDMCFSLVKKLLSPLQLPRGPSSQHVIHQTSRGVCHDLFMWSVFSPGPFQQLISYSNLIDSYHNWL